MRIKIDKKWYDSEQHNIMVVLDKSDREHINEQPSGSAKLADFKGVANTIEEMSEFMEEDMSKGWSNA